VENELIYNTEFSKGVLEQTSYNFHFMNVTMPFIRNEQITRIKNKRRISTYCSTIHYCVREQPKHILKGCNEYNVMSISRACLFTSTKGRLWKAIIHMPCSFNNKEIDHFCTIKTLGVTQLAHLHGLDTAETRYQGPWHLNAYGQSFFIPTSSTKSIKL
jgi:hypothetical protein